MSPYGTPYSCKHSRGRGEAEVYLKLHRGSQNNAYISMQYPSLELLAQAESRRQEELMRSLDPLVKVCSPVCVRSVAPPCSCKIVPDTTERGILA